MKMIINEILSERERQTAKFGVQNHTPAEWLMILGEEVGEVNRAALEYHFQDQFPEIFTRPKAQLIREYRKELIQVAAVCVAMIENIDKTSNYGTD
jgi:NTP pyrophosphatase (non-canonical NTP hydrolase)